METQKKQSGLGIAALILGIIGMLLACIFVGIVPCIIGLIFSIIVICNRNSRHGFAIAGLTCCLVGLAIFTFMLISTSHTSEETEKDSVSTMESVSTSAPTIMVDSETAKLPEEVEQEYKDSCQEVPYKTLLRNPEDYIGTPITITVKIEQILQSGWIEENQYYRAYTNDEYGMWYGDEYLLRDARKDDNLKILTEDIVKVYAEFLGMEEIERALTGTKEEVPAIKVYYLELIENEKDFEGEENGELGIEDIEILAEYTLSDGIGWYTRHFMVIKNNSDYTVDISTSSLAYSADGAVIGAEDSSLDTLGAGCVAVVYEAFEIDNNISYYETDVNVAKSKYYEDATQDLSYVQNDIDGGAVFQVTNNGEEAAEFVQGYVLFFMGQELVDWESAYFTDDDSEIKPGKTISKQINTYKDFDRMEFYLTGRR